MSSQQKASKHGGIRAHSHLEGRAKRVEDDEPLRSKKVDRNAPCPCGSGQKHKRCCATREESFLTLLRNWFGL